MTNLRIAAFLIKIMKLFGGAMGCIRIQTFDHSGAAALATGQRTQRVLPANLNMGDV